MATTTTQRPAVALRTPLYPILAVLGALIVVGAFMPWATVDRYDGTGQALAVTGMDSGGWGPAAVIAGLAIVAIAIVGYFWNPFSDPEAVFIAGFALATMIAGLAKMVDTASLVDPADEFDAVVSAGGGLWLIIIAAALGLVGATWIVMSRPSAEARLG